MNRITLLFGANSSGKTSVIQALLLLKQTITENRNHSVLLPNGSLVALGSFREFIHKHDESKEMRIGIESDFGNKLSFSFRLKDNIIECIGFEGIAEKWLSENSKIDNWSRIRYRGEIIDLSRYNVDLINHKKIFGEILKLNKNRNQLIQEIERKKHFTNKTIQLLQGETPPLSKADVQKSNAYYSKMMNLLFSNIFKSVQMGDSTQPQDEFAKLFSYLSPQDFEQTAKLLKLFSADKILEIFDEITQSVSKFELVNLLNFEESLEIFNPLLSSLPFSAKPLTGAEFKIDHLKDVKQLIVTDLFRDYFKIPSINQILDYTHKKIVQQLMQLLFLGPLRREPQRYYFFSGSVPSSVGKKGGKTAETLYYSKDIQEKVNKKLEELGIEYHVNVTPIADDTKDIFSVRLLDRTLKTDVGIADVGFGISQILPIIVQSYLSVDNIICIEQPEIHIHPRLQTELAQLFYERIKENSELQYVIETHSEHLILRFQKLIRKKLLDPKDISVLYLLKEEEGIVCKELEINQKGDFVGRWPEGFFEEAFKERFG